MICDRISCICICIWCDHICICAYEEPVLPVARLFRVVERWGESHHTPRGINVAVFVFSLSLCICTISYLYLSHHTPRGINAACCICILLLSVFLLFLLVFFSVAPLEDSVVLYLHSTFLWMFAVLYVNMQCMFFLNVLFYVICLLYNLFLQHSAEYCDIITDIL